MAHVIRAGDLGEWLAVRTATERLALLLLIGGQLRAAAEPDTPRLRAGTSLAGAGADQLALELGQAHRQCKKRYRLMSVELSD